MLVIHAFRRDELYVFNLQLKSAELTTCYLQVTKQASAQQLEKQNKWLYL